MAIRDLITSDPYYQNLVNPRGFPNTYTPPPATIEPVDPNAPTTPLNPDQGIINAGNQSLGYQGGDGNNQNVRTDYQPNYDYRQYSEYGLNPSTEEIKQMDMNSNYFNEPQQSATGQFLNQAMNFMPGIGGAKRAMEFLGGALPPNQRAILENELRGSGVYTDDIGRVVGDINTAEGVMAGYNANKITDQTYTNRRDTIANTLFEKYGMSQPDIDAAIAGTYEGDIETSLIDRLGNLNKNQFMMNAKKKQAQGITNFQNKKRDERKEAKLQEEIRLDNLKAAQVAQAAKEQQVIESIRQQYASQGRDYGQGAATGNDGAGYNDGDGGSYSGDSIEDYGGGEKDGGMIGYRDGGLASMFTRRR